MPYIATFRRELLDKGDSPVGVGELTYVITTRLVEYLEDVIEDQGGYRFEDLAVVVAALECSKMEMYRRVAEIYEDRKIALNGDVYDSLLTPDAS